MINSGPLSVSAIIPTYNRSNQVVSAINSVINQSYRLLEVVVVDDGSTDDTEQVLATFGDRIRYLKKKNGGVSSARNYGILHSTGNLIAFLDSDDLFLPDKLEKQVTYLQEHQDFGVVLSDCYYITPEGERTGRSFRRKQLPYDGNILESVLLHPSFIPSSALVRKELLVQVGMFDENLKTAEDLDLHLKLAGMTKIGLIPEPLLEIAKGGEGLSLLSRTYDDHVLVIERFISQFNQSIPLAIQKKAYQFVYQSAAQGKFWNKEWGKGLRYCAKASRYADLTNIHRVARLWLNALYLYFKS